MTIQIIFSNPNSEYHTLFTDGSHSVDRDAAGMGGYILDPSGFEVFQFSQPILDKENYAKHEACALQEGLKNAHRLGIKNLLCYCDDIHLVEVFNTKDKTLQNHYVDRLSILKDIQSMLSNFDNITFQYIPRRQNKKADSLARNTWISKSDYKSQPAIESNSNLKAVQHYSLNDKKEFQSEVRKIKTYLICTLYSVAEETWIKSYTLNLGGLKPQWDEVGNRNLGRRWLQNMYDYLTFELTSLSQDHSHLGFYIRGNGRQFEAVLRGIETPGVNTLEAFNKFKSSTYLFESIVYHPPTEMISFFKARAKKKIDYVNKTDKDYLNSLSIDTVLENMRALGNKDYQIGTRPDIEAQINKSSVEDLQKKYFSQFLKLVFIANKSYKINPNSKALLDKTRVDFNSKISGVKADLKKLGVSLLF